MPGRGSWVARVAVLAILVCSYAVAKQPDPHWLSATGDDWEQWSPEAKEAYLAGFLAGGGLAQALNSGAQDSAAISLALDSLRRAGFRMPFGTNVYGARLEDYFWYQDRRPRPLWYALWEVNNDLKRMMPHE